MKNFFLLVCCVFTFQLGWSQSYSEKEIIEIQEFLIEFSNAAKAKDTTLLKTYIFTSETNTTEDYQSDTIQYILQNNELKQGDFAFSDKALQVVIEEEIQQFKPIPEHIYNILLEQPDGIFYEATKDLKQNDIPLFDYKDAHIILVQRDTMFQLVFWESLNNVLKPN